MTLKKIIGKMFQDIIVCQCFLNKGHTGNKSIMVKEKQVKTGGDTSILYIYERNSIKNIQTAKTPEKWGKI